MFEYSSVYSNCEIQYSVQTMFLLPHVPSVSLFLQLIVVPVIKSEHILMQEDC